MAEGGDFGYDDPALDDGLDHDDDEQGVALSRARRPLPTMAVKQSKCKQGNTRRPGCLILLMMKKPLCLKELLQSLIFKNKASCGENSRKL